MLGNVDDIFYPIRLIADTRLHLSTIMAGQYSEQFYINMCKIIETEIYLGYVTAKGKRIEISCMKEFLYSIHYGLGVKNMPEFVLNITKTCLKDTSKTKYALRFVEWLKANDPNFDIPQKIFEYRRLRISIRYMRGISKKRRWWLLAALEEIYKNHTHLLEQIGQNAKYKTIEDCCFKEGIRKKEPSPIKLSSDPKREEVEKVAKTIYRRIGKLNTRILIATMLELYQES